MKETKDFSCDNFSVGGYPGHIYISVNPQKSQYLFSDGKVRNWSEISDYDEANKLVYFKTTEEAEKFLKEFKQKHCEKREESMVTCKEAKEVKIGSNSLGFFIFVKDPAQYLHKDGMVGYFVFEKDYFPTKKEAETILKEFQQKMCKSANVVSKHQIYLQLENETSPIVQPITARLVTDHSGGRIVLQVQTPDSPEFVAVARLAVKDGKVVMFREQGVESEFINTDSQGRIQN